MIFEHKPVLLDECIENLNIKPDGIYVDGTLGGGGHSAEILKHLGKDGLLIGIDQDNEAIAAACERLSEYGRQVSKDYIINLYTFTKEEGTKFTNDEDLQIADQSTKEELPKFLVIKTNFENVKDELEEMGIEGIDGILLDIGVSSHQLDEAKRGFSYMHDAPLDMRMDRQRDFSAMNVVNEYSEKELSSLIREYGEENWAARIAKFIVQRRKVKPIESTSELVEVIEAAIPKAARADGSHPAKRTFQAIRIDVNRELDVLKNVIDSAVPMLKVGGRICIITFHSLEDRIVKLKFQELEKSCVCPKEFPVCICNKVQMLKVVTKKPVTASTGELLDNKRAKSAKLRVGRKI